MFLRRHAFAFFITFFVVAQIVTFTSLQTQAQTEVEHSEDGDSALDPKIFSRVDSKERLAFRHMPLEPDVFWLPGDQMPNRTNGIPLGTKNAKEFEAALKETIAQKGEDEVRNSFFYIWGVSMRDEAKVQARYERLLKKLKLEHLNIQVQVYSVPRHLLHERIVSTWMDFYDRMVYFFPSIKRDGQRPVFKGMLTGAAVTITQNIPNMIFLAKTLPASQAALIAMSHMSLHLSTTFYFRFLANWMMRSQVTSPIAKFIEITSKQMMVTSLFVLNYQIFHYYPQIGEFMQSVQSAGDLASGVGQAFVHLVREQGLTLILNTIFYSQINNKGFGRWLTTIKGTHHGAVAETMMPFLRMPSSAINTLVLSLSAANFRPLFDVGVVVNTGHVLFAGAIVAGTFVFWKWPRFLDVTLDWYESGKRVLKEMRAHRREKSMGIFGEPNINLKLKTEPRKGNASCFQLAG